MIISTERLLLVPLTPTFHRAALAGDAAAAELALGFSLAAEWLEALSLYALRLPQLEADSTLQPWLVRAVVLRSEYRMIGHAGFHTGPNPEYLATLAPGGIEFGYTIYPAWRRRGFAREAALGLMDWAAREHGIQRFVASVSPSNAASLGLIAQLGFLRIGSHIDEVDGLEHIFERRLADVSLMKGDDISGQPCSGLR